MIISTNKWEAKIKRQNERKKMMVGQNNGMFEY